MKILKPMTALVSVPSCVAGGFLTQKWRDRGDADEGGDAENIT